MEFVLGKARLTFRPGQGYQHPRTGQWLDTPLECLRGWMVEDPAERHQWVELAGYIDEYWKHQPPATLDQDLEVDFGE